MTDRRDVAGALAEVHSRPTGARRVPYPVRIRELEVLRREMVGPTLLRLTLGGDGIAGFQSHVPGEHVKILFPDPDGTQRLPEPNGDRLRWPQPLPPSRQYTVRRHDPGAGELDLDVVLHPGGLASEWARTATPGERIHVAGPPGGYAVPTGYDRWLFAGDLTAQPAIAVHLGRLPDDAVGWAFVEVADAGEELDMPAPPGVAVRWVHRGAAEPGTSDALVRAVGEVEIPDGATVFAWIAAEVGPVQTLRRWVRAELGLGSPDSDITGYWKRGAADFDEDHEGEHGHGHGH